MTITKERLRELARASGGYTDDGVHWEFDHFDPYKFAKQIRNEVLEEARVLAWKTCSPSGDEFGHGYNKAAVEIERAVEAMKEQL